VVLAAGLAISLAMLARAQAGGDQLNLLARGWLLAERGQLVPYGNPLSNEGKAPGPLTSILVGLPLLVWRDQRAPIVLVLLCHLAAWLLLDAVLRRVLRPRERLLFAVVFWLNPWRLYFSGFLWNPNYLFAAGALHCWACYRQRERGRFLESFLLAGGLGLAFQLHPSFMILFLAAALLWWRGWFRVSWPGAVAGGLAAAATLVPWLRAALADPSILPGAKGFPLRGLLAVFPLARGLLYWLRYGSFHLPGTVARFDFGEVLPAEADEPLRGLLWVLTHVLGPVTVVLPLLACVRLGRRAWRRAGRSWRGVLGRRPAASADRRWLEAYVLWTFGGAVLAFCLTPTTVMMWQALLVLHAAVLPLALWGETLLRSRRRVAARRAAVAWTGLALVIAVALAGGGPHYRCRGEEVMGLRLTVRQDHPMLHDLGLAATCPYSIDPETGWWPDVLPAQ
jgi:hypothetical protein